MSSVDTALNKMMASHQPEQIDRSTNMCRADVTIYHHDSLAEYRKLPDGIVVTVFDSSGKAYPAKIESGESVHNSVLCGEISWQLSSGEAVSSTYTKKDNRRLTEQSEHTPLKASDGYVLIKARNQSDDEFTISKEPLKQLADPLKVQVSFTENKVEAVYLPPPILVNLRLRQNEPVVQLKEKVIQQLIDDGGHATLFIHGYNVPLGSLGRFASSEELGEQIQYKNQLSPEQVQKPYLYYDNKLMKQAVNVDLHKKLEKNYLSEGVSYTKVGDRDVFALSEVNKSYDKLSPLLNGKEALSWFPHVEFHLNLAASGKKKLAEFNQWDKYSRIVGVTWSGSVDPDLNFFRAEMYANEAGRELADVLKQLLEQRVIKINIITHSLGARVALSAMNILGDMAGEYDNRIDNLILWEPAVADNALTNLDNYDAKKVFNPLAMEIFPYAHKVPKHITVLYSQEDGVLGSDHSYSDYEPVALIGGAYPSKYLSFTTGNSALKEYYKDTRIYDYEKSVIQIKHTCDLLYAGAEKQYRPDECAKLPHAYQVNRYKQEIAALIREEAARVNDPANHTFIPPLTYLKPWSHFKCFPEEVLNHIIDVLIGNALSDWEKRENYFKVRAALGHQGDRQTIDHLDKNLERLSKKRDLMLHDTFIKKLREEEKKLEYFGQVIEEDGSQRYYFISHSAMRTWEWLDLDRHQVFPLIYEYSYKREMMDKKIQKHSKFGRYPNNSGDEQ